MPTLPYIKQPLINADVDKVEILLPFAGFTKKAYPKLNQKVGFILNALMTLESCDFLQIFRSIPKQSNYCEMLITQMQATMRQL